jgi:cytochrome c2
VRLTVTALIFLVASPVALAEALLLGDVALGKKLYNAQCTSCHDTSVHTRKDRNIKTLEGLIGQVNQCNTQLDRRYTDAQVNDLIAYLNSAFYQFSD